MIIDYISDIHINNRKIDYSGITGNREILLLLGDITTFEDLRMDTSFFRHDLSIISSIWKKVYWIPGNHEYYGSVGFIESIDFFYKKRLKTYKNIQYGTNIKIKIKDWTLLLTTLWANLTPVQEQTIKPYINDFVHIKDLSFYKLKELYNDHYSFLKKQVDTRKNSKIIIGTHFAPTHLSSSDYYKNDICSCYFCNSLGDFIAYNDVIKYWLHGHIHESCYYQINECKVIANPKPTCRTFDFKSIII